MPTPAVKKYAALANKMAQPYRPVQVYSREWVEDKTLVEGGTYRTTPAFEGTLLMLGVDYQMEGEIAAQFPVGVVESPDGYLHSVPIENIQFIGPTDNTTLRRA